jgi:hypothetical protein
MNFEEKYLYCFAVTRPRSHNNFSNLKPISHNEVVLCGNSKTYLTDDKDFLSIYHIHSHTNPIISSTSLVFISLLPQI